MNSTMRKLYVFMMISLDGFFEGESHDLRWHNVDEEFNEFAVRQMQDSGALLFGHRTYDLMAGFWPTHKASPGNANDAIVADLMKTMPKYVFSHEPVEIKENENWKNVHVITQNVEEEIKKLKAEPGKDLAIFGSNNFATSMLEAGLLDEVRVIVNPVAIGKGNALFTGIKKPAKFKLTKLHEFKSGNVLMHYAVR
jgi:dihydrofolate reductase